MSETTTTAPSRPHGSAFSNPRPDDKRVREQTKAVAAAAKSRARRKDKAHKDLAKELRAADEELAEAIRAAREYRVPWEAIEKAAGLTRQTAFTLTKNRDGNSN